MGLKQHPVADKGPIPTTPDWGSSTDYSTRPVALRFEVPERTVSYPYAALMRWEWKYSNPELLIITAVRSLITIRGHGLDVLREALDAGRLQHVCEQGMKPVLGRTHVHSITIEAR